jgi:hypothetical protein
MVLVNIHNVKDGMHELGKLLHLGAYRYAIQKGKSNTLAAMAELEY